LSLRITDTLKCPDVWLIEADNVIMKRIKLTLSLIVLILMISYCCKAQQVSDEKNDANLLAGTWVAEGATLNDKWVFSVNGTMQEYTYNRIETNFSWKITNSTNSGVKSKYLKLTNTIDPNDVYNYEISILNKEKMVLIYQRKNNMGISKPITFIKQ